MHLRADHIPSSCKSRYNEASFRAFTKVCSFSSTGSLVAFSIPNKQTDVSLALQIQNVYNFPSEIASVLENMNDKHSLNAVKQGWSFLFVLSDRVIQYGDDNRMTVQNVAIVFGPTLLRPEMESQNIAMHMVFQNQIVEFILNEYDRLFYSS